MQAGQCGNQIGAKVSDEFCLLKFEELYSVSQVVQLLIASVIPS